MRLRYYLRGLGLGILFAVIIIAISGKNKNESLSDSQIKERASELGMVSAENIKSHTIENDSEVNNSEMNNSEMNNSENSTEKGKENSTEKTTENANTAAQSSESQATENNTVPEVPQTDNNQQQTVPGNDNLSNGQAAEQTEPAYITITVSDGEVCRDIATDLQSKGLVDDAEKFRLYMGDTGYASFIHNGDFQIPVGATYEEIANILLKK